MVSKKGFRLFNNNPRGHPRTPGTGYGSAKKARKTLKLLKGKPNSYRKQVITTLMYRAKFHKFQTPGMRNAYDIFQDAMKTTINKTRKNKQK
jgi:hypothetical protein